MVTGGRRPDPAFERSEKAQGRANSEPVHSPAAAGGRPQKEKAQNISFGPFFMLGNRLNDF